MVVARQVGVVTVGLAEPVVVGIAPEGYPGDEGFTGDGGAPVE